MADPISGNDSVEDTEENESNVVALVEKLVFIGSEIRQMRKARMMTLKQLARDSQTSISHLSAIERGTSNPSLAVIQRISRGLRVDPSWFFTRRSGKGPMERAFVVRKNNRRNLNVLYGEAVDTLGLTDELLSSSVGGDFFMGIATFAPFSSRAGHAFYQHEGEQHGLVVKGQIELQIDDEEITLYEGDSYSFPTQIIHKANNVTDQPAQLIWAISPIVFPSDVVVGDHFPTQPNSNQVEINNTATKKPKTGT